MFEPSPYENALRTVQYVNSQLPKLSHRFHCLPHFFFHVTPTTRERAISSASSSISQNKRTLCAHRLISLSTIDHSYERESIRLYCISLSISGALIPFSPFSSATH